MEFLRCLVLRMRRSQACMETHVQTPTYLYTFIFTIVKFRRFFLHKNTETSSRRIITLKEFTVGLKQIYNM